VDREAFIDRLRRSGLVRPSVIDRCLDEASPEDDGLVLARQLVADGQLTAFQAKELLLGRSQGFFLGPYRILDRIDRGGAANVFTALHTVMKRTVALKAIPLDLVRDPRARAQFRDEVRTAAKLIHPHIALSYDANRDGNVFYMVMELVPGPNLRRLVRKQGPVPPALAVDLMRHAAEALDHAHRLGIIHCDIKPANFLVANAPGWIGRDLAPANAEQNSSQPPCLKILDFGISRMHGRKTRVELPEEGPRPGESTGVYGTPDFVAPEQAHDLGKADARSDLYSLGCTFYFALAGRVPFPGETSLEKLIKHLSEEPRPLEEVCPTVPKELAEIVRKLMAKHPGDRFQNAAELLAALQGVRV
jgi:serine/threonine-protein kinase